MFKKRFAALLLFGMLLQLLPTIAFAAKQKEAKTENPSGFSDAAVKLSEATEQSEIVHSGICGDNDNISWTLDSDGTLIFSGSGPLEGTTWDEFRTDIRKIIIGEGITSIGSYSFGGHWIINDEDTSYPNLSSVVIPSTVSVIHEGAFERSRLTKVDIPFGVTEIGSNAFGGCAYLESVIIPDSVIKMGESIFQNCSNLSHINWPEKVTAIPISTFCNCDSLEWIEIPDSVNTISRFAFQWCNGLKNVVLPNHLNTIGECAFYSCPSLKRVFIPASVTRIENGAFDRCSNLEGLYYCGTQSQWNSISFPPLRWTADYYPQPNNDYLKRVDIYGGSVPSNVIAYPIKDIYMEDSALKGAVLIRSFVPSLEGLSLYIACYTPDGALAGVEKCENFYHDPDYCGIQLNLAGTIQSKNETGLTLKVFILDSDTYIPQEESTVFENVL